MRVHPREGRSPQERLATLRRSLRNHWIAVGILLGASALGGYLNAAYSCRIGEGNCEAWQTTVDVLGGFVFILGLLGALVATTLAVRLHVMAQRLQFEA
jgi:hypothetical protein